MIMIDADDVCQRADSLRADIIAKIVGRLGLERTMFETSGANTSEWFVKRYGPRVPMLTPLPETADCLHAVFFFSWSDPWNLFADAGEPLRRPLRGAEPGAPPGPRRAQERPPPAPFAVLPDVMAAFLSPDMSFS